jgi:putative FmdB family regulatory protein
VPLYEYKCERCGKQFEVIEKFSDAPLTTHENCGGAVHRLLSAPALQFKGSGWYITDYAKSGGRKDSGASDNGAPAKSDSGSGKTGSETTSTPASNTSTSDTKSGSDSSTKSTK